MKTLNKLVIEGQVALAKKVAGEEMTAREETLAIIGAAYYGGLERTKLCDNEEDVSAEVMSWEFAL